MKKILKSMAKSAGVIEVARFTYQTSKLMKPETLKKEVNYRLNGLPDGYPHPPSKLIFLIIGHGSVAEYYESGKIIVADMVAQLRQAGIDVKTMKSILDFGCGCGRLIRHFTSFPGVNLYGSDYNKELIKWCKKELSFGTFSTNDLEPPTNYADEQFDLIFARSVFTHLTEKLQMDWIKEIRRILKPGGVFYFTTHGDNTIAPLTTEQKSEYFQGRVVVENSEIEGDNKCTSFESREYVEKNLLEGFDLVNFVPGSDSIHLKQDVYIVRKLM